MEAIFLGGNDKSNIPWLKQISEELKESFSKVNVYLYKHWKLNEPFIDLNYETKELKKYLINKKEYVVIAKSAGAVLTLKAIHENVISPIKCIFLGLPLNWTIKNKIPLNIWIKNSSIPILFIQNVKDPFLSSKDLKEFLIDNNAFNYSIVEINREDHTYNDFERMRLKVNKFLK